MKQIISNIKALFMYTWYLVLAFFGNDKAKRVIVARKSIKKQIAKIKVNAERKLSNQEELRGYLTKIGHKNPNWDQQPKKDRPITLSPIWAMRVKQSQLKRDGKTRNYYPRNKWGIRWPIPGAGSATPITDGLIQERKMQKHLEDDTIDFREAQKIAV